MWRIQRNNQRGKRHTLTVTVAVVDHRSASVDVNPKDVAETTYRASGAGGQHRNKTDSAVRLIHAPTGLIVRSEAHRSQHENRREAWDELRRRLTEAARTRQHAETNDSRVSQISGSRDWTWNEKAGIVTRVNDGRSWPIRTFTAGKADIIAPIV